jgi:hypothetical protein
MKKIISLMLAMSLFSSACLATCDWSKIVKNADGTYTYSQALNLCVGQTVQDNVTKAQQITDYTKALTLKDLAITKSDARADLWMSTSLKLEENVQKVDTLKRDNEWIFFGLGALTVIGAGMAAAQLSRIH